MKKLFLLCAYYWYNTLIWNVITHKICRLYQLFALKRRFSHLDERRALTEENHKKSILGMDAMVCCRTMRINSQSYELLCSMLCDANILYFPFNNKSADAGCKNYTWKQSDKIEQKTCERYTVYVIAVGFWYIHIFV